MWCDTFDADLLKVVPGAAEALGPAGDVQLETYSTLRDGKINCPSSWGTDAGMVAFFWTNPLGRPPGVYVTSHQVASCTFLEAVRDEWIHSSVIAVDRQVVWHPPVRLFLRLMYDLRGWKVLPDAEREAVRQSVRDSLKDAAARLAVVVNGGER